MCVNSSFALVGARQAGARAVPHPSTFPHAGLPTAHGDPLWDLLQLPGPGPGLFQEDALGQMREAVAQRQPFTGVRGVCARCPAAQPPRPAAPCKTGYPWQEHTCMMSNG